MMYIYLFEYYPIHDMMYYFNSILYDLITHYYIQFFLFSCLIDMK